MNCTIDPDLGADRDRLHICKGRLVATDGRIMLNVEDPAIVPEDGEKPPREDFLAKKWEAKATIAGPRQIAKLAATLVPAWQEERRKIEERRANFDAEAEARNQRLDVQYCPHCGETLVIDRGEAMSLDEWAEFNRPDESDMKAAFVLESDGLDGKIAVSLRYFGKALYAAQKLGGAERLDVCERPVVALRGQGWYVAFACLRDDYVEEYNPVARIRLEKEDAE